MKISRGEQTMKQSRDEIWVVKVYKRLVYWDWNKHMHVFLFANIFNHYYPPEMDVVAEGQSKKGMFLSLIKKNPMKTFINATQDFCFAKIQNVILKNLEREAIRVLRGAG